MFLGFSLDFSLGCNIGLAISSSLVGSEAGEGGEGLSDSALPSRNPKMPIMAALSAAKVKSSQLGKDCSVIQSIKIPNVPLADNPATYLEISVGGGLWPEERRGSGTGQRLRKVKSQNTESQKQVDCILALFL